MPHRGDHRRSTVRCRGPFAFWIGWGMMARDRSQPLRYACPDISDNGRGVFVPDWLILVGAQPIRNANDEPESGIWFLLWVTAGSSASLMRSVGPPRSQITVC